LSTVAFFDNRSFSEGYSEGKLININSLFAGANISSLLQISNKVF